MIYRYCVIRSIHYKSRELVLVFVECSCTVLSDKELLFFIHFFQPFDWLRSNIPVNGCENFASSSSEIIVIMLRAGFTMRCALIFILSDF